MRASVLPLEGEQLARDRDHPHRRQHRGEGEDEAATLAATSAPSAISSTMSVIGSESMPALPTSAWIVSSTATSAEPPPN